MKIQVPVKQVAAIHDLSGIGRTSLSVVIPILSAMGVNVCPLPTAVLSSHSRFEGYHFVDLTQQMQPIINHWKSLNISFDAIYSGFLGSPKQINIVRGMIDAFKNDDQIVIIDPVLGDNGKKYGPISEEMVLEMRSLIQKADIITPNLTEAALLLNEPFDFAISEARMKEWIVRLSEMGPQVVVVTSVPNKSSMKNSSVIAFDKGDNHFYKVPVNYIPADFPGTGDCFTSVLTGALLQGDSLPIAIERAVYFISCGVRATLGYHYNQNQGILLERVLNRINLPIPTSNYEIF